MPSSKKTKPLGGCFACRANPAHPFACLTAGATEIPERAHLPHLYKRGQVLFYEGNAPLAVYCIQTGSVRISRGSQGGRETVIGTRTAGDLVGFRAAFANMPYGATAQTTEPSRICAIPRDAFLDLVGYSGPLALELLRRLAMRSRLTEEQLVSRALEPVVDRIIRLLLATQAKNGGAPDAGISREEMAVLIGTTRETLSRTLHQLAQQGLVEVSASRIQVLDEAGLRAILGS